MIRILVLPRWQSCSIMNSVQQKDSHSKIFNLLKFTTKNSFYCLIKQSNIVHETNERRIYGEHIELQSCCKEQINLLRLQANQKDIAVNLKEKTIIVKLLLFLYRSQKELANSQIIYCVTSSKRSKLVHIIMSGTTGITSPTNGDKWLSKDIVKKSPNAQQILEALPIKFKKMVRQLIDFYEDERIQLMQQRIESPRMSLELYAYKQKLEQIVKENSWQLKEIDMLREKDRMISFQLAELQHIVAEKQRELIDCHHIVESINNLLDFERENFQYNIDTMSHKNSMHEVNIKVLKEKITELEKANLNLKQKIQDSDKQNKLLKKQLGELARVKNEALGKTEKLERDLRKKKILQIRTSLSSGKQREMPNTPNFDQHQDYLRTSCFRKLSEAFSPTIKLKPAKSINENIRKAKQILGTKVQVKQQQPSEPDSIEFGKEKVIQKKKIRKILSEIISASDSSKRRIVIQQLANEVGLRQIQIESFLDLF